MLCIPAIHDSDRMRITKPTKQIKPPQSMAAPEETKKIHSRREVRKQLMERKENLLLNRGHRHQPLNTKISCMKDADWKTSKENNS